MTNISRRRFLSTTAIGLAVSPFVQSISLARDSLSLQSRKYPDGRPQALLRMDAKDHGIVLRYGDGPDQCDILGARDVWVFEDNGTYYMHYDAAGPKGWLCSLAVSDDLVNWKKRRSGSGFRGARLKRFERRLLWRHIQRW